MMYIKFRYDWDDNLVFMTEDGSAIWPHGEPKFPRDYEYEEVEELI